jgi:hypothetical protein
MLEMQKIQKRCGFNGLAGIDRPAENRQKMQKFASAQPSNHCDEPFGNGCRNRRIITAMTQLSAIVDVDGHCGGTKRVWGPVLSETQNTGS